MAAGSSTYEFIGTHYEDYQNQYNYKEPLTSGTIDSLTVYSNGKQILESRDLKKYLYLEMLVFCLNIWTGI